MKKLAMPILLSGLLLCAGLQTKAQSISDILNTVKGNKGSNTSTGSSSGGSFSDLSNADITNGLKEALSVGAKNASNRLSLTDGFF